MAEFRGRLTSEDRFLLRGWLRHYVDIVPVKLLSDGKTKVTDQDGNSVYDKPIRDVRCFVSGRRVRLAENVQRIETSDGEVLFWPDQEVKIDDVLMNPRNRVRKPLSDFNEAVVVQPDSVPHPDRRDLVQSIAILRR